VLVRPVRHLFYVFACAGLLLGVVGVATPAYAATITVNTTADEFNAGSDCSLREAIQSANTNTAFGGCTTGSGADTILIPAGTYTVTRAGLDDLNVSGDFDITSPITIQKAGAGTVTINGNGIDRVFQLLGGSLTLEGLTVTGGNPQGVIGGGIVVNVGC
jgi:CSLREA domain-containing protein